jgi:hypothetical protein
VMRVQEDGRRSGGSWNGAKYRRMRPVDLKHPDAFEPGPLKPGRGGLRRSPYLAGPEAVRANRWYSDEALKVGTNMIEFGFDNCLDSLRA